MRKNKFFILIGGVTLLISLLLITYIQSARKLEIMKIARAEVESYLKIQYPDYNMQITDFEYKRKHSDGYCTGTARADNNLNYTINSDLQGNVQFVILKDEVAIRDLNDIAALITKDEILDIKELKVNTSLEPIPQGNSKYHIITVEINIEGLETTPEQLSQKIAPIRDKLINAAYVRNYFVENMNLQYTYFLNGKNNFINLHMDDKSLQYLPEQLVGIMKTN